MSLENQNTQRIFGLDFVRGMAIISVLISHIYYLIGSSNPFLISISGVFGYIGVELFFVLSGFLIGTILLKMYVKENYTFSHLFIFLKRRWFRTLPNYFLVLLINIIIAISFQFNLENLWKYFFFLQNTLTYSITFFAESWSLSMEEWIYFLSPFTLLLSVKIFTKNRKVGYLVTAFILILFFHLMRYYFYKNNSLADMIEWNTKLKSIVFYRLDSIVFGFLLAWIHYYYKEVLKKYSVYLFIISVHLFFLQFFVLNVLGFDIHTKPLYFYVFYFTLTSFISSFALPVFIFWEKTNILVLKPLTLISKISYSMYLLHYSIVAFLMRSLIDKFTLQLPTYSIIIIYLLITFFFSFLLYRFYEKPMMDLRDKI